MKNIDKLVDDYLDNVAGTDSSLRRATANVLTKTGKKMKDPVWNKGKTGVQEAWNKGISATEEQRKKMSESQKRVKKQPHKEETKEKMRQAKLGVARPDSMKQKLSATKTRPVMTPDGIFPSRKDAAAFYGLTPNGLSVRMKYFPNEYYYVDK